jgi:hypothetical protein
MAPAAAPCVDEATTIGVDEATKEEVRRTDDEMPLPVSQLNSSGVLAAGAMLGKPAWPGLRVGVDLGAPSSLSSNVRRETQQLYRPCTLGDDLRVALVQYDPELVYATGMGRQAPITEIEPQEVDVGEGELGKVVSPGSAGVATIPSSE